AEVLGLHARELGADHDVTLLVLEHVDGWEHAGSGRPEGELAARAAQHGLHGGLETEQFVDERGHAVLPSCVPGTRGGLTGEVRPIVPESSSSDETGSAR